MAKVNRATRCSLKFASQSKLAGLREALHEYAKMVNHFIALFWKRGGKPSNKDCVASLYNTAKSGTARTPSCQSTGASR
jgi:hypothetical protein